MKQEFCKEFISYCQTIRDFRQPVKKTYPLEEIIFLVFCATLAECDGWDEMVFFGEENVEFLRQYLPYEHGIPSPSTMLRVISTLSPEGFEKHFQSWFMQLNDSKHIAIDGKTIRGSKKNKKSAVHLIHACDSKTGIALGYKKVNDKSNEIPSVPELIKDLDIQDRIITLDAMGCQRATCETIINNGGDYVIGLKGNQGTLYSDIKLLFDEKEELIISSNTSIDKGHGRIEERTVYATEEMGALLDQHKWPGLKTAIMCKYHRVDKKSQDEVLYFISSTAANAEKLLDIIRSHWSVESTHWILDVTFNEDKIAIAVDNAAENLAFIRRVALNMIKLYQSTLDKKTSIKRIRKMCLMKTNTISDILNSVIPDT